MKENNMMKAMPLALAAMMIFTGCGQNTLRKSDYLSPIEKNNQDAGMVYEYEDLKELAKEDLYNAREKLITRLMNYQAYADIPMAIVFDGYKVKDNFGTVQKMGRVEVIYTRTDETADQRIEKMAYDLHDKYTLTVVSSDGLIQNAVFSQGALRMSARELRSRMDALDTLLK